MTDQLVDEQQSTQTTDGEERDRMSHIVYPAWRLADAIVNGTKVTALCGKTWTPSHDPKKYPVCRTCVDVYNNMHDEKRDWEAGE